MAQTLTTKQRNALPKSAFAYPATRRFPVPTAAQARAAGISEGQRQRILRNAVARAAQTGTSGSKAHVRRIAMQRSGGPAGQWGGSSHAQRSGARRATRRTPVTRRRVTRPARTRRR
jgi:hypothetical protein